MQSTLLVCLVTDIEFNTAFPECWDLASDWRAGDEDEGSVAGGVADAHGADGARQALVAGGDLTLEVMAGREIQVIHFLDKELICAIEYYGKRP